MSTIVALATPPGIGALHVIRLSGKDSFEIINKISSDKVEKTEDRLQITFLKSRNNQWIDQVVLLKYYSPNSYTGEDCVEISCHGNNLISKLIIDELVKHGAVHAKKGEFTKRAYLNNKIDLNQAINIGKLFSSNSELDIYSSVNEIRGASSKILGGFLKSIIQLLAECELNIDYPAEIEKDDPELLVSIRKRIHDLFLEMNSFLEKSKTQRLSNYRVVFVGRPNAGKSSFVNYLINRNKIIVSDVAGTTRDSIEVDFVFDKYLLTLVDTAGLDGVEDFDKYAFAQKSKEEIESADLVVYLISSVEVNEEDISFFKSQIFKKPYCIFYTKQDLVDVPLGAYSVSVKNRDVSSFLIFLQKHLEENYSTVGIKSQEGINYLYLACEEVKKALSPDLSIDLIAENLNFAYDYLSQILGLSRDNSEKINYLFDNFCVGK